MWKVVLLVSLLVATMAPARAADHSDWLMVQVEAGPEGAEEAVLVVSYQAEVDAERTSPLAWGFAGEFRTATVGYVDDFSAETRIVTTREFGGLDVTAVGDTHGGRVWSSAGYGFPPLAPGETATFVDFLPGFALTGHDVSWETTSGSIDVAVRTGSGSGVVPVVAPDAEGPGARIGPAAAGWIRQRTEQHVGLVGGLSAWCTRCRMTWRAPDGGAGALTNTHLCVPSLCFSLNEEGSAVSGPSGEWQWSWQGASERQTGVLAGYAPIGDDWTRFRV